MLSHITSVGGHMLDKIFGKNTLTYIANAGVMISTPYTKIIIDGVIDPLPGKYIGPEEGFAESLILSKEPYHNIDYIFVTHAHKDHISPQTANELLKRNKHIRLICPRSVTQLLRQQRNYNDMLAGQIFTAGLQKYSSVPVSFEDFSFTAYRIPHDGETSSVVENLAYFIQADGKKILALGDCTQKVYDFEKAALPQKCDVLLCPANMVGQRSGREIINMLRPKQVVLCHLKNTKDELARIKNVINRYSKSLPKVTILTEPTQKIKI